MMAKSSPLSNTLTEIVQAVAKQRNTSPETIEEWLYHFLYETPINLLNDEQILALADFIKRAEYVLAC
jgi:uncharacterized protein YpuA (DUF1002 family)